MRKNNKLLKVLFLFLLLPIVSGCNVAKNNEITIILEDGDYRCNTQIQKGIRGQDFTFYITLDIEQSIVNTSYNDYWIEEAIVYESNYRWDKVVFHNVRYSSIISFEIEEAFSLKYHAENIDEAEYVSKTHERINTSIDYNKYNIKPGYKFVGWDNSGEIVSLGSRIDVSGKKEINLDAIYLKEEDISNFEIIDVDYSRVKINKYLGDSKELIIPDKVGGKYIDSIAPFAFDNLDLDLLVLPKTLVDLYDNSFNNCHIKNFVMFDNIYTVDDNSFSGCVIEKIRINSVNKPAYNRTYFGTFADKVDRLYTLRDKKKIVLYSGSSTRFGYNSQRIDDAFKDYDVVNMGVYAYTGLYPQVEIISHYIKEGDVCIISPEFDSINRQFDCRPELDGSFFPLIEPNYDLLNLLDIKKYTRFFDSFKEFQDDRRNIKRYEYRDSPSSYDEDVNPVRSSSYNKYGDYIVYRKNNFNGSRFGLKNAYYNLNYFSKSMFDHFNNCFLMLKEKGARLFFEFAPRMNTSISDDSTKESRDILESYLKLYLLGFTFLSNIEESLMDPLYFYGTDNHLSSEGVEIRTSRVIERLSAIINP